LGAGSALTGEDVQLVLKLSHEQWQVGAVQSVTTVTASVPLMCKV